VVFDGASAVAENSSGGAFSGFTLDVLEQTGPPRRLASEPPPEGDDRVVPLRSLVRRFLDAVRAGRPFEPGFREGARVQVLMEAVAASAAGRVPVLVESDSLESST
jgi:predicted dehydrogenase